MMYSRKPTLTVPKSLSIVQTLWFEDTELAFSKEALKNFLKG